MLASMASACDCVGQFAVFEGELLLAQIHLELVIGQKRLRITRRGMVVVRTVFPAMGIAGIQIVPS